MEAALAPVSDVQEAAWHSEDLSGPAIPGDFFSAFTFDELVELGSSRLQDAETARRDFLHCLLAVMRIAGDSPSQRRNALNDYARAIGWKHTWRYLHKYAALALTIHPQELSDRFPDVPVTQALLVVEQTALPGQRAGSPEQRELAVRVLESAADRGLSQDKTRVFARQERDRYLREETPLADIGQVVELADVPLSYRKQFWSALVKRFRYQLKADRPGTDTLIAECLDSLEEDALRGWIIKPAD